MDRTEQKPNNPPTSAGGQPGRPDVSEPEPEKCMAPHDLPRTPRRATARQADDFSPCEIGETAAALALPAAAGRSCPPVGMVSNPDF